MSETATPPPGTPDLPALTRESEEANFFHEAALNATWTGVRLAVGALSFAFGCFVFAYFYLRSLNSHGMWHPAGVKGPQPWAGAVIMALVVVSALVQYVGLTRIKASKKGAWQASAVLALVLGLAADRTAGVAAAEPALRSRPASSGFASVFVGATPDLRGGGAGRDDLAGDR
jgi:hypothetical protein